jgi:cell wall-associated NlpC family hydrolase
VSTRPAVHPSGLRRSAAIAASVLAAGALATFAAAAGAAPQPTVTQVQQKVSHLTAQLDQAAQQYDQTAQELATARQQLTLVNREVNQAEATFTSMRAQIAAIASDAYESGTMGSVGALLTADNPQAVLSQASALLQLSSDRSAQVSRFIAAAHQLEGAQQMARRTEAGIAVLSRQRLARKSAIGTTLAQQTALLNTLTAQQQAAATVGVGGTTSATYTGPTNTQAEKAVAFAYAQLGKPYLWGGTGPGAYDCSGLVQAAWAAAGIAIPRDTYSQVAGLPAVPLSNLQPGDLVFFDGDGHVAMYVGGGMIIDAPRTGEFVQKISLSESWYASTVDSAARP